jgi:hypothetical protein
MYPGFGSAIPHASGSTRPRKHELPRFSKSKHELDATAVRAKGVAISDALARTFQSRSSYQNFRSRFAPLPPLEVRPTIRYKARDAQSLGSLCVLAHPRRLPSSDERTRAVRHSTYRAGSFRLVSYGAPMRNRAVRASYRAGRTHHLHCRHRQQGCEDVRPIGRQEAKIVAVQGGSRTDSPVGATPHPHRWRLSLQRPCVRQQ